MQLLMLIVIGNVIKYVNYMYTLVWSHFISVSLTMYTSWLLPYILHLIIGTYVSELFV